VGFVSIPTLIRMKQAPRRPHDLDDIQHPVWFQKDPMSDRDRAIDWDKTSFDDSRREQLRRVQAMTIGQRLEALEKLTTLSERLQVMPKIRSRDARTKWLSGDRMPAAELWAAHHP
jgi:hypothetical protein